MEEVHPSPIVLPMDESEESSPVNNNIKPGSILRVESDNEEEDLQPQQGSKSPAVLPKQSWLLRLFESTLFDPSMAMTYLFNSKALTDSFGCGNITLPCFRNPECWSTLAIREK